jgi:LmbE family N-acetylglucosaminyl deacetylase
LRFVAHNEAVHIRSVELALADRLAMSTSYYIRPRELTASDAAALSGRIMVIAPHPDDESLGCGGLLAALALAKAQVEIVFLTSGRGAASSEGPETARRLHSAEAALRQLGIAKSRVLGGLDATVSPYNVDLVREIALALRDEMPRLILLPHPGEQHSDHRGASPCVAAALAKFSHPSPVYPRILFYEVWTPLVPCDLIFDISEHLAAKRAAIASYDAQTIGFLGDAVIGLNRYRGVSMLSRDCHAEVFKEAEFAEFMALAAHIPL